MTLERRGGPVQSGGEDNQFGRILSVRAKPFDISKRQIWDAYKRVKANRGGAGVDGQSLQEFEVDLSNNLYKLWNRMSSGSYFPPPVCRVEIPKKGGGKRLLGIPTVSDRIAQAVVKDVLEPLVEPCFHQDSYGYRPKRSALDAVGKARERCWEYPWVLDLDIQSFFDTIDHDLLMKAVDKHMAVPWARLYIQRWLKVSVRELDGSLSPRDRGTPQGGVISPLLANLFLHYAFDCWMARTCPAIRFERYADDIICHCRTQREAEWLQRKLEARLGECGLRMHPGKTRIVYCRPKGGNVSHGAQSFDFLSYEFRPRQAVDRKGRLFISFTPAVSPRACSAMRKAIRKWRLSCWMGTDIFGVAKEINPIIRGWLNYYGRFCRSAMGSVAHYLNFWLMRWVTMKYKRFRKRHRLAWSWLAKIHRKYPDLFAHWVLRWY